MSAIAWKKLPTFHSAPPCSGGCMTFHAVRGVGCWRLEILGEPGRVHELPCKKSMTAAWNSAHDPEPVQEPVQELAAAA